MKIDLEIDHLRLPTSAGLRSEDLASAIESELDRLSEVYGLPAYGSYADGVDIDLASFPINPDASIDQLGASIARSLMHGLHQERGRVPRGLDSGPDAPHDTSSNEVQR